jgi:hypothetical protein
MELQFPLIMLHGGPETLVPSFHVGELKSNYNQQPV